MSPTFSRPEEVVKPVSHRTIKLAAVTGLFFLVRKFMLGQLTRRDVVKVLGAIVAVFIVKKSAKRRYNTVKGEPVHFPVIGSFHLINRLKENTLATLQQVSEDTGYRPFEACGPMDICFQVLQDPKDFRYMLKDNWTNFVKYNPERGVNVIFEEMIGTGIFAADGDQWSTHRKAAAHMFSARIMKGDMQRVFNEHGRKLCDIIDTKAQSGEQFDLQVLFSSLTFDSMCEIAFGVSPNTLDMGAQGKKSDFLESFDAGQNLSFLRFFEIPEIWKLRRAMGVGNEAEIATHVQVLYDYVESVVVRRRQQIMDGHRKNVKDKSTDLLTLFINHAINTGQTGEMLQTWYLRDMVLNFMIAGRDTTSVTLTNIARNLSRHPDKKAKFLAEVEGKFCANGDLDADVVGKAPYQDACFNETLRMHPPVAVDSRFAVNDDVMPSGFKIRAGAMVVIPTKTVGTNPDIYPEPRVFKPERWLAEPAMDTVKYAPGKFPSGTRRTDEYKQPIFWGGPRVCMGKDMARLEVKTVVSHVLRNFDLEILPHEERYVNSPVAFFLNGMPCKATKRV